MNSIEQQIEQPIEQGTISDAMNNKNNSLHNAGRSYDKEETKEKESVEMVDEERTRDDYVLSENEWKNMKESVEVFRDNTLGYLVFLRTYARKVPCELHPNVMRREFWVETVNRYVDFMKENLGDLLRPDEYTEVFEAIKTQQVLPSMRLLQFAGDAARRDHCCAYNCSYLVPSDIQKMSEAVYLSLSGVGVGFSVSDDVAKQLPLVCPRKKTQDGSTYFPRIRHVIEDNIRGWAVSFRVGLQAWFDGMDVEFDYSDIRPQGTYIKKFSSYASGPDVLRESHEKARSHLFKIQGRKMTTLELHDLMCILGEVSTKGGLRRSAMISLSDLNDEDMKLAKSGFGEWWNESSQRRLANNSAVYMRKPSMGEILDEFSSLINGNSGERGIFNISSLLDQIPQRRVDRLEKMGYLKKVTSSHFSDEILPENAKKTKEYFQQRRPCVQNGRNVEDETMSSDQQDKQDLSLECTIESDNDKLHLDDTFERRDDHNTTYLFSSSQMCFYRFTRRFSSMIGTNPCGEILLLFSEFCNLCEGVGRMDDTLESLKKKQRILALLGTYQSTLTSFQYISDEWRQQCEGERLLGISWTGIAECPLLRDADVLEELRNYAITCNKMYAKRFSIAESSAITCIKPSGTASPLVGAHGIHFAFSRYYLRRVRIQSKDPICAFLFDVGVPRYPEVGEVDPENPVTWVYEIPMKTPEGVLTSDDMSALDQLELWKKFKVHYTEHNPSCSVYVRDSDEWMQVISWVYKNFDLVGGLSFFPKSQSIYKLMPFEKISKSEYEKAISSFPRNLSSRFWELVYYETNEAFCKEWREGHSSDSKNHREVPQDVSGKKQDIEGFLGNMMDDSNEQYINSNMSSDEEYAPSHRAVNQSPKTRILIESLSPRDEDERLNAESLQGDFQGSDFLDQMACTSPQCMMMLSD